jgi:hypothetical protein
MDRTSATRWENKSDDRRVDNRYGRIVNDIQCQIWYVTKVRVLIVKFWARRWRQKRGRLRHSNTRGEQNKQGFE